MLELLAPAGSPEAVTAAVQAGADAVYMGYGDFNARRGAKNFTPEEYAQAVSYCHVRGVKVYLTLNTLLTDRELPAAAELAAQAYGAGTDAVLVQDLGAARMLRQTLPELPLHASTQMTVCSLDGVKQCADLGFTRAVLARELTREQIESLCARSPIELEVFLHGALCMCYSGQCYFSAVVGGRSGNRGMCAQPCRLPYGWGKRADGYPLSLKDLSLAGYLRELRRMGVKCVKLEGRMKRAEYVGIVTDVYARAIKEDREPTPEDLQRLRDAFSRQGFTDGYYTGKTGPDMFGVHEDLPEPKELYAEARERFLGGDVRKTPVKLYAMLRAGASARLAAEDPEGRVASVEGPVPESARTVPLDRARVEAQLSRTGGTPYACEKAAVLLDEGLSLPVSALNAMRREVLEALTALRADREAPPEPLPFRPGVRYEDPAGAPVHTVSLRVWEQLSPELLALRPAMIWLPVSELRAHRSEVPGLLRRGAKLGAALPRIARDDEMPALRQALTELCRLGLRDALTGNPGLIACAREAGLALHGDFGLNVFNSQSIKELKRLGFVSATASFELNFPQIRDLNKALPVEVIVYGRLPLMITENCIVKNSGVCPCTGTESLTDRRGVRFPVLKADGCRSEIFNSKLLFLADKSADYAGIGAHSARLDFTTEDAGECVRILDRYVSGGRYTPGDHTRGLYYRGVE